MVCGRFFLGPDKPVARTRLNQPLVLFHDKDGKASVLEDHCCHRAVPLSLGTLEDGAICCGYHGLLFNGQGQCLEFPGQVKVPGQARIRAFHVVERDQIIWLWHGKNPAEPPESESPEYPHHSSGKYLFDGDVYHYEAPWQLIHDNLLDLSHLGYVHLRAIGGNAKIHMNAQMQVTGDNSIVRIVRHMPGSEPPPTYTVAYPFKGRIDRWQEIEFRLSHLFYHLICDGLENAGHMVKNRLPLLTFPSKSL